MPMQPLPNLSLYTRTKVSANPVLPLELMGRCFELLLENVGLKGNMWLLLLNRSITEWIYVSLYESVVIHNARSLLSFHTSIHNNPYRIPYVHQLTLIFESDHPCLGPSQDQRFSCANLLRMEMDIITKCGCYPDKLLLAIPITNRILFLHLRNTSYLLVKEARCPVELCLSPSSSEATLGSLALSYCSIIGGHESSTSLSTIRSSCWPSLQRLHMDVGRNLAWMFRSEATLPPWQDMPALTEVSLLFEDYPSHVGENLKYVKIPSSWRIFAVFFFHGWDGYLARRAFAKATFNRRFIMANYSTIELPDYATSDETNEAFLSRVSRVAIDCRKCKTWDVFWRCARQHLLCREIGHSSFHDSPFPVQFSGSVS